MAPRSRPGAPAPVLTLVGGGEEAPAAQPYALGRKPETVAERVRRLQEEARLLAREEIEALELGLQEAARRAGDIAAGGDAYPVGAREIARQLAEDLPLKAASLKLLVGKAG